MLPSPSLHVFILDLTNRDMNIRPIPVLLCLFAFLFSSPFTHAQVAPYGVNLSGLEWNGTAKVPTLAEMNYYKGKGLSLLRIPFLWERMQPTLGGALSTSYLTTIDNVVANAKTAGVSLILDMHNYCRYPYNGSVINSTGGPTIAQFAAAWKLIAAHYAAETTVWAYDLMNEPNSLGSGNHWFPMAQAAIDSIRLVDKTHVLLVEGEFWAHASTWTTYNDVTGNKLSDLVDPNHNLIFQAHQYFDSDGSGSYKSNSFSTNGVSVNTGVTQLTPFVNWLKKYNLKGMLGEYGVPGNNTADQANWNSLIDNLLAYLQTNCVMATYWAGGPGWTYLTNTICIEPSGGNDAPQMAIVSKYTTLGTSCTLTTDLIEGFYGQEALLKLSPNPFSKEVTLDVSQFSDPQLTVQLRDMAGLVVEEIVTSPIRMNLGATLQSGMYLLQVSNGERVVGFAKLIKQ